MTRSPAGTSWAKTDFFFPSWKPPGGALRVNSTVQGGTLAATHTVLAEGTAHKAAAQIAGGKGRLFTPSRLKPRLNSSVLPFSTNKKHVFPLV